jgi:peroxiredoxin-like protein
VAKEHLFTARAEWEGLDDGAGKVEARGFASDIALPAEFGGSREGTNAEELLLAALASCLTMTLAYSLERHIGSAPRIEAKVEGTFVTAPLRLDSVRVHLLIGPTTGERQAIDEAVAQAEHRCMVSNLIRKTAPIEVSVELL